MFDCNYDDEDGCTTPYENGSAACVSFLSTSYARAVVNGDDSMVMEMMVEIMMVMKTINGAAWPIMTRSIE